jgi:hypothetical protein
MYILSFLVVFLYCKNLKKNSTNLLCKNISIFCSQIIKNSTQHHILTEIHNFQYDAIGRT